MYYNIKFFRPKTISYGDNADIVYFSTYLLFTSSVELRLWGLMPPFLSDVFSLQKSWHYMMRLLKSWLIFDYSRNVCQPLIFNFRWNYIYIYYEFSLLRIFSLVIQPWMSAYIRKTDGVYMYVFGLPYLGPKKQ